MRTKYNINIENRLISNYLESLVDRFYKILPLKESCEETLPQYLESLLRELIGFDKLVSFISYDDRYVTLLSIVQYLIDNDVDVDIVRTDVFRAINILKKIKRKYCANAG